MRTFARLCQSLQGGMTWMVSRGKEFSWRQDICMIVREQAKISLNKNCLDKKWSNQMHLDELDDGSCCYYRNLFHAMCASFSCSSLGRSQWDRHWVQSSYCLWLIYESLRRCLAVIAWFFCSIIACHVTVFTVLWCVGIHLPSGSGALQSTVWRCDFAAIFRISFQRKDVTVGKTQVSGEFVAIYLARTWLDPWHGSRQVACTKVPNVLNDKWSSIYACSYSMLEQSFVLWSRRHPHLISWQI